MTFIYWVLPLLQDWFVYQISIQGSVTKLVGYLYTHTFQRIPCSFVIIWMSGQMLKPLAVFLLASYSYNQISNYISWLVGENTKTTSYARNAHHLVQVEVREMFVILHILFYLCIVFIFQYISSFKYSFFPITRLGIC